MAAETWSVQELLSAGWSEADLAWEMAAERAAEAVAQKDQGRAKDEAGQALRIARAEFKPIDPRLGTSLANFGLCLHVCGHQEGVAPLLREALDVWRRGDPWIARMDAPRVARSSLFHLRMEALHRDTYRARWQQRWAEIAAEARARLEALSASANAPGEPSADAFARWRRERPAMLNDTRKLMAAGFLLLAPSAPSAPASGGKG
ncbi:MAG: hypothetical protein WBB88_00725 [Methyloceanibacter sp.]